ncbi:hypothetical protein MUO32_17590 [Shinella sp. CPCC 101442]|uniref:hypothetical protein n=1 Tax=Shinella sp. CPCC 101442 TaxID=2932265 RepID=UPI0021523D06|nr:hypothetical protein [Shinella sp. CPCC 101442]MCR6500857.1 hypothetical protein [Shinella sp. CPCC 101442]
MSKAKPTATVPTDKAVIAVAVAEGRKMIEAGKSKIDTALAIYEKLEGTEQDVIVKAFIEGATLTEKDALTYWYNCRRRIANPSADTDETRVDMILLNLGIEGVPPSETNAFGKCRYDNPFQGVPAKVRCNGTMEDGAPFEALFVTDGSGPRMLTDLELSDLPSAVVETLKPGLSGDPKSAGQQ